MPVACLVTVPKADLVWHMPADGNPRTAVDHMRHKTLSIERIKSLQRWDSQALPSVPCLCTSLSQRRGQDMVHVPACLC